MHDIGSIAVAEQFEPAFADAVLRRAAYEMAAILGAVKCTRFQAQNAAGNFVEDARPAIEYVLVEFIYALARRNDDDARAIFPCACTARPRLNHAPNDAGSMSAAARASRCAKSASPRAR